MEKRLALENKGEKQKRRYTFYKPSSQGTEKVLVEVPTKDAEAGKIDMDHKPENSTGEVSQKHYTRVSIGNEKEPFFMHSTKSEGSTARRVFLTRHADTYKCNKSDTTVESIDLTKDEDNAVVTRKTDIVMLDDERNSKTTAVENNGDDASHVNNVNENGDCNNDIDDLEEIFNGSYEDFGDHTTFDEEDVALFGSPLKCRSKDCTIAPAESSTKEASSERLLVDSHEYVPMPARTNDSVQKVKDELYDLMKGICDALDTCCLDQLPLPQRKEIKEHLMRRKNLSRKLDELLSQLSSQGMNSNKKVKVASEARKPWQANSLPCAGGFYMDGLPLHGSSCSRETAFAGSQKSKDDLQSPWQSSDSNFNSIEEPVLTGESAMNSPILMSHSNYTGIDDCGDVYLSDMDDLMILEDFAFDEDEIECVSGNGDDLPPFSQNTGVPCTLSSSGVNTLTQSQSTQSTTATEKYKAEDCSYYEEVLKIFKKVFGLNRFRMNQRQAILAALAKKDCFILMPTGGGKSLCYQLTALVTPGVTVVVSPLRSLILDQVQKLVSLKVPAAHLSSDQSLAMEGDIYLDLRLKSPEIKLLYVTPEKLSASKKLIDALNSLNQRNLLDRFVIDEAHCISQWGHDFRKDYKKLSMLREKYPEVPIMGLTATATPRVQRDVLNQLQLKEPEIFIQSFNRRNLQYSVRPKTKKALEEIATMIIHNYRNSSGIIYCFSRRECEKVATYLRSKNISARPYHAGLKDNERIHVHESWLQDTFKVVCATIAFGMGIDKPDVRFVVHHSLPKSVEGYFQESGRAGRDGRKALCVLYYMYSDMHKIRKMIESDSETTPESKKVHMDNLYRVVQYCENVTDCRRAQLLHYFGETTFDAKDCINNEQTVCDNCESSGTCTVRDCTAISKLIVKGIKDVVHGGNGNRRSLLENKLTMNHFIDIFMGSEKSKFKDGCPTYNAAQSEAPKFSRNDAERLFRFLLLKNVVEEQLVTGAHDNVFAYLKLGPKAKDIENGVMKISLAMSIKRKGMTNKRKREKADSTSGSGELSSLQKKCFFSLLEEKRKEFARAYGFSNPENILQSSTIFAFHRTMPTSRDEMLNIDGVTENKFTQFGNEFLEITRKYAAMAKEFKSAQKPKMTNLGDISSPYFCGNDDAQTMNQNKGGFKKNWSKRKKNSSKWKSSYTTGSNKGANNGWKSAKSNGPGFLGIPEPKKRKKS